MDIGNEGNQKQKKKGKKNFPRNGKRKLTRNILYFFSLWFLRVNIRTLIVKTPHKYAINGFRITSLFTILFEPNKLISDKVDCAYYFSLSSSYK